MDRKLTPPSSVCSPQVRLAINNVTFLLSYCGGTPTNQRCADSISLWKHLTSIGMSGFGPQERSGNWVGVKVQAKIRWSFVKNEKMQTFEGQLCSWDPLPSDESRWKPGWAWLAALPPTQTPTQVLAPAQHTAQTRWCTQYTGPSHVWWSTLQEFVIFWLHVGMSLVWCVVFWCYLIGHPVLLMLCLLTDWILLKSISNHRDIAPLSRHDLGNLFV